MHRFVVPNYFRGDKHPILVSPEGAALDFSVIDALSGNAVYAQAGGVSPAAKLVGHCAKLTGSASVVRNGVTVDLQSGDAVYQNDVVQTGSNSTLGLVFNDGTSFNLSANARFMLNDLTFDVTSTSNSAIFTLVEGAASFVAGQIAKTGDMRVDTPVAVIGIRGTAVNLDISSSDGRVAISVIDQRDGEVHAVQVSKCVSTGIRDPLTGLACSAGDLIGTVSSNGPSLSLTPTAAQDLIVQQINKTPVQLVQEFNAFQAAIDTYNIQKAIEPSLPQHTENNTNNSNPQSTKYASLGSTPATPVQTEASAELIKTSVSQSTAGTTDALTVTVFSSSSTPPPVQIQPSTFDNVAPAPIPAVIIPHLMSISDSGISNSDSLTNVTAPSFTVALGTGVVAGDTVELLLNGSPSSSSCDPHD